MESVNMSAGEMSKIEFYFTSEQKRLIKIISIKSSQLLFLFFFFFLDGEALAEKVKTSAN